MLGTNEQKALLVFAQLETLLAAEETPIAMNHNTVVSTISPTVR